MFRISQFMRELAQPTPVAPRRNPPGPVVIWNLIRRCNLTCKHCYSISGDVDFPGELSTAEIIRVMGQALPRLVARGLLGPEELPLLRTLVDVVVHGRPVALPVDGGIIKGTF